MLSDLILKGLQSLMVFANGPAKDAHNCDVWRGEVDCQLERRRWLAWKKWSSWRMLSSLEEVEPGINTRKHMTNANEVKQLKASEVHVMVS